MNEISKSQGGVSVPLPITRNSLIQAVLHSPVELDPTLDFIAGTVSGMAALVVGHPFDTVKVRFQTPDMAQKYGSIVHALATIVREEKFVGLYKGITSPLATVALMNGLVFSSYKFFLKLQLEHSEATPTLSNVALAGAGSGIISSIVTTPIELIKIRQQSSLSRTSTCQVALQILKDGGLRGLYRGWTATILRDIGYGAYFFAYEATLRAFASTVPERERSDPPPWPALLVAGGVAGIIGWAATFPFDVVKTRIQGTENGPSSGSLVAPGQRAPLLSPRARFGGNPYRNTLSTIIHSYRTEGIGVFFRGLATTVIRAIPVNMVTFATFEVIVHTFSR